MLFIQCHSVFLTSGEEVGDGYLRGVTVIVKLPFTHRRIILCLVDARHPMKKCLTVWRRQCGQCHPYPYPCVVVVDYVDVVVFQFLHQRLHLLDGVILAPIHLSIYRRAWCQHLLTEFHTLIRNGIGIDVWIIVITGKAYSRHVAAFLVYHDAQCRIFFQQGCKLLLVVLWIGNRYEYEISRSRA